MNQEKSIQESVACMILGRRILDSIDQKQIPKFKYHGKEYRVIENK